MKLLISLLFASTPVCPAVTLVVDYSYDLGAFQPGSAARATIERAAADLSSVLPAGQLAAVPTRSVHGFAQYNNEMFDLNSSIDMHLSHVVRNPGTGDIARLANETFALDEIRIYVGMNQFLQGIVTSGQSEVGLGVYGSGYQPSWQQAMDMATTNANILFGRGTQVRADQITGVLPMGSASGSYSVGIAPMAGWISFASEAGWQRDSNAPVGGGQRDLYSYAMDQMLGILGVMPGSDPALGERSLLNSGDLTAMQAAGWNVIPEPSAILLSLISLPLIFQRRK